MATYHCCVKKGKAGTALRHADYILREGVYAQSDKKEELTYKASGNLPEWAVAPQEFWNAADQYERANSNVYYEFEIALPNELSLEENRKIVDLMIQKHIVDKAYTYAIHEKPAALGDGTVMQPHVHLMFSERCNDGFSRTEKQYFARANSKNPDKGGARKDGRFTASLKEGKASVIAIRQACETYINDAYRANGIGVSVSAASLEKQREDAIAAGDMQKAALLDRTPENHLGPKLAQQSIRQAKECGKAPTDEDCFLRFANERSRSAFVARALREVKMEMAQLDQEIAVLKKKEAIRESSLQAIDKIAFENTQQPSAYAKDYHEILRYHSSEFGRALRENRARIYRLQKGVLASDRLLLIAQSVYTKGQSKILTREHNALLKERKAFDRQLADFRERPVPMVAAIRAIYDLENARLAKTERELSEREGANRRRITALKEKLDLPVAQSRVGKIVAALERKNEIRTRQIKTLQIHNAKIQNQLERLQTLKSEFAENLDRETVERTVRSLQAEFDDFLGDWDEMRRQDIQRIFNLETMEAVRRQSQPIQVYGYDFVKVIDYHINQMEEDLQRNNKEVFVLKKYLFSDEKLAQIAQSVYTKGKSKTLMRTYNALLKERKAFDKAVAALRERPLPKVWDMAGKVSYYAEQERLEKWQRSLSTREKQNLKQISVLQTRLDQPEAKDKMGRTMDAMRQKMRVREQRILNFQENSQVIVGQLQKLRSIKKEINGELRNYQFSLDHPITTASMPVQVIQECNSIINQFRTTVAKAEIARAKSSMAAKLKKFAKDREAENDEYERD